MNRALAHLRIRLTASELEQACLSSWTLRLGEGVQDRTLHVRIRLTGINLHQFFDHAGAVKLAQLLHRSPSRLFLRITLSNLQQKCERCVLFLIIAGGLDDSASYLNVLHRFVKTLQRVERTTIATLADRMCGLTSQFCVFGSIAHEVRKKRLFTTDLTEPVD